MCRNGIHLNTNGWYVKFIKFLYKGNVDITKYKSLCPIFWILIASIFISPLILFIKLCEFIGNIRIGYFNNANKLITIGKCLSWLIAYIANNLLSFVVFTIFYCVFIILTQMGVLRTLLWIGGLVFFIVSIISISIYCIKAHIEFEYDKYVNFTFKYKILYFPYFIIKYIIRFFIKLFNLITVIFFWIYKQCCPIVKWNNNK